MFIKDCFLLNILVSRRQIKKDLLDHTNTSQCKLRKQFSELYWPQWRKIKTIIVVVFLLVRWAKHHPHCWFIWYHQTAVHRKLYRKTTKDDKHPKKDSNIPVKAYTHHWNQETAELASKRASYSFSQSSILDPQKPKSLKMYTSFMKQGWGEVV